MAMRKRCRPEHCANLIHSWSNNSWIGMSTLNILAKRQGMILNELHLKGVAVRRDNQWELCDKTFFTALVRLVLCDIDPWDACYWIVHLLLRNRSKLRELQIGYERELADDFARAIRRSKVLVSGINNDFDSFLPSFKEDYKNKTALNLDTLRLINYDISDLQFHGPRLFDIFQLQTLCIESCDVGSAFYNAAVGLTKLKSGSALRLKTFRLRHEDPDDLIDQDLNAFLSSFSGLVHLSILLERSDLWFSVDSIIRHHGKTLETLVFDQRKGPQLSPDFDTHMIPIPYLDNPHLTDICDGCPNLRELGISVGWSHNGLNISSGVS